MPCYVCNDFVDEGSAIGCSACLKGAHRKCVNANSLSKTDLKSINWVCTPCLDKFKNYLREGQTVIKRLDKYQDDIQKKLGEVESKIESINNTMTNVEKKVAQPVTPPSIPGLPSSYASVAKKHLLVLKSTDDSQKASDMKHQISTALSGVQIVDTMFKHSGNVILNFENETERDKAATKVGNLNDLNVTKAKKLLPKIMVCNVNACENEGDLIDTIIERNDYLKSIENVSDKIKVVFVKNAAGGTKHFILRCQPEVRGLIHKNGDDIKLKWGVYKVRDRYFATMCYHCLKYGHGQDKCPDKDSNPCCKKCGENHSFRECESTVIKCLNCVRAKKSETNHCAGEICCPILSAEIEKIKNRVDHGY